MMKYDSLRQCIDDLGNNGHLVRIGSCVDPYLEMAEIHRQVCAAGGPAVYFSKVKGSPFPAVSNLFGTRERLHFIFRHNLGSLKKLIELRANPRFSVKHALSFLKLLPSVSHAFPRQVSQSPVLQHQTTLSQLPQIQCWGGDGGAFITLPQVYSEHPSRPGVGSGNLGMYRVQISGNQYQQDRQAGLHYQIHRGIGIHHCAALQAGCSLKVSIFIGGPPSHTIAAVMPLPEGLSELAFAGVASGRRFPYCRQSGNLISAQADFCIVGTVEPGVLLPEGPFGDHLGYYSMKHPFPVIKIQAVYHRPGAIWPFTVVGRPPQEDSVIGGFIHELTGPLVPSSVPGVKAIHAVDAAGVHPLMLAIGSERYTPYNEPRPMELLTQAHALLGFGQCSLAKYLLITAPEAGCTLDIKDIKGFLTHILERANWERDLHFITRTTMDTLDYSGGSINQGSKLIMAVTGPVIHTLAGTLPANLSLPEGFSSPVIVMPGVLAITAPVSGRLVAVEDVSLKRFCRHFSDKDCVNGFRLIILADDSAFLAASLNNFLWATFTRSDPARDIDGVGAFVSFKHWGCKGSLVIDARAKPHHAPVLETDKAVADRVKALGAKGGPLQGII